VKPRLATGFIVAFMFVLLTQPILMLGSVTQITLVLLQAPHRSHSGWPPPCSAITSADCQRASGLCLFRGVAAADYPDLALTASGLVHRGPSS